MKVFISHSTNEANVAKELCEVIESNGERCFIAPRDIRAGYEYAEEIANGIDSSDVLLLVLSKAANDSVHVLREVERAVSKHIPILVYKIEDVVLSKSMEYFLMTHQWIMGDGRNYEDVVKGLCTMAGEKDAEEKVVIIPQNVSGKPESSGMKAAVIGLAGVVLLLFAVIIFIAFSQNKGRVNGETEKSTQNPTLVSNETQGNANETEKETEKPSESIKEEVTQESSTKNEDSIQKTDSKVALGDTIKLGKYNGEEIYWRVLKLSDDGKQAIVVARDVISVKAPDAAESGRYNYDGNVSYYSADSAADSDMALQAKVRGNSSWKDSNIRTWLNSNLENVTYEGQPPVSSAMADGLNGYNTEKGFLCGFTKAEQAAILETQVKTNGNALAEQSVIMTKDKVFLLSLEELEWFKEANVSVLAEMTKGAIDNNKTFWYKDYCLDFGTKNMMWWLREPVKNSSSKCYLVGNGYREDNIYEWEVGVESFGIRPAMTVDVTSDIIQVEK